MKSAISAEKKLMLSVITIKSYVVTVKIRWCDMVHLETVEELAESLADACGIYGCGEGGDNGFADHPDTCNCRICFVSDITERIRQAVKNDVFLANMKEISRATEDLK
jgi:hypothetical protein